MWCVPTAVAALVGGSREKVWLDILAERHERGRRLTNLPGRINEPHGGLHAAEALRAIGRAGYRASDAWRGTRRMNVAEFWRWLDEYELEHGRCAWLVLQRMHMAHVPQWGDQPPHSLVHGLPIAKAWRVDENVGSWTADADLELMAGTLALGEVFRNG